MTLQEMRDYLANFFNITLDPQDGHMAEAEVDELLHQGHMRMFSLVANQFQGFCFLGEESSNNLISETVDTRTYDLPTNCYRLIMLLRVVAQSGGRTDVPYPLDKVEVTQGQLDTERYGWPLSVPAEDFERYWQNGNKSITLMSNSPASVSNSLQVYYIYRPAKMATDNSVPFQESDAAATAGTDSLEEFHELIPLYAMEWAALKDDNTGYYDRLVQRRREIEGKLTLHLRMINAQKARGIHVIDDDLFENVI